jgi:hypothetical protein
MEGAPHTLHQEMMPKRKEFSEESSGTLLFVSRPDIPIAISNIASSLGLKEKDEFHASVVAGRNAKRISTFLSGSSIAEKVKTEIKNDFLNQNWDYLLLPEYFVMEKFYDFSELGKSGYTNIPEHTRSTLIQKIKLSGLTLFYEKLSQLTHIDFSLPLAHITLFSGSDYPPMADRGIGIYSEEDFKKYLKSAL